MEYEYKVFTYNSGAVELQNDETLEGKLNYLGNREWELVSVSPITKGDDVKTGELKFIFKRGKIII